MSKPLNGDVRPHVNQSSIPFNSIRALSVCGNDNGLTMLLSAMASNDPVQVARCDTAVQELIYAAESIIRVLVACKLDGEEGLRVTESNVVSLGDTASALLTLAANALIAVEEANYVQKGGCYE